jgi:hypothetical protein
MDFKTKCQILNQVWSDYKFEVDFKDFIEYNDLGLPLAALIDEEIVSSSPRAEVYVEETYLLLIHALGIEDKDYDSLEAMFFEAGKTE